MNKLLLIPLLTLIQTFSFSQNSIDNAFNIFKESSGLENASISFQVIDLSNSSEISSYNSNTVLPTASTAKLFSRIVMFLFCLAFFISVFSISCKENETTQEPK